MVSTKYAWLIGISAMALASSASAQTVVTTPQPTTAPPSTEFSGEPAVTSPTQEQSAYTELDDIVVTANKREQRLNDVGITVAVVSGNDLKDKQINTLADIANTVPGLTFSNSANGTPIYTLRGVGFIETSIGAYPTVSTYLDEVALSFPVLSAHTAFDLERVEVLKGPQGTLFGQNATGGAINFIAAKPTNEFAAGADLTYGRFNQVLGEAYVSGPLSDTLKARLAGRIERADGWQVSNTRPDDRNGKVRNYMGRFLLAWEPSSRARFLLNLNGWKDDSETQAPQYTALQPQQVVLDPDVARARFSPMRPRAADWTPGIPFRDNRLLQSSLRGDFELTDDVTLTSLTAYTDFKQRQGDEGDGLPARSLDLFLNRGKVRSFSQELRLSNGPSNAFRWVIGGNYERSRVRQIVNLDVTDSSSHEFFATALNFQSFGSNIEYTTRQKFTNYAGFANVEYDIVPTITLKGGIRYTKAENDALLFSVDPTLAPDGTGAFFYNILLGGALGPYRGQPYAINNLPTTINGVAPGRPGAYADSLNQDNVSYKVGVDWKPRDGILVYANVAKGYKAGSFPTVSASVFSQYLPVTQESVQAYEAGFKASLIDRTLQFNGAAFYYDYQDKQLRSKTIDQTFGILDILQNIPKSSIKGFEVELVMRPTRNFVVNAAFTYIDAKIDRFSGVNAGGLAATFDDTRIPLTPKYQIGVNADWSVPLSDGIEGFLGASLNYRSDTTAIIGGDINPPNVTPQTFTVFGIDDYALVDLRAGIKSPNDRWRLSIFGKNVFNKYYWNNVVAATDTIGRYAGLPATYGVSLGFRY